MTIKQSAWLLVCIAACAVFIKPEQQEADYNNYNPETNLIIEKK